MRKYRLLLPPITKNSTQFNRMELPTGNTVLGSTGWNYPEEIQYSVQRYKVTSDMYLITVLGSTIYDDVSFLY